ncbi:hypothetical protein GGI42DRAFT_333123 [Trichoderma sp. SZMC 28013]
MSPLVSRYGVNITNPPRPTVGTWYPRLYLRYSLPSSSSCFYPLILLVSALLASFFFLFLCLLLFITHSELPFPFPSPRLPLSLTRRAGFPLVRFLPAPNYWPFPSSWNVTTASRCQQMARNLTSTSKWHTDKQVARPPLITHLHT